MKRRRRQATEGSVTLLDVALISWHVLGVLGTYQIPAPALLFENLKQGTQSRQWMAGPGCALRTPFSTFPLASQRPSHAKRP